MGNELLEMGIGKLGYGNMRLPRKEGKIDYDTVNEMIDTFLKSGNSYFDTAYIYENSESVLNETLVKCYPREKYRITTKLALINADKPDDMNVQIETSLKRLGLDHVDFYLLHGLSAPTIEKADRFGAWDFIAGLKEQGLPNHIGFSFHGTPEELDL
ncbi:MAG: aldo/keto reductase [Oscillospiraceae bacterium]|nr:aldo/keto reductase [Oscillospiraceae bacterium]